MTELVIDSVDELYGLIAKYSDDSSEAKIEHIKFGESLSSLKIKYKGDGYNGSLTAASMEGIVEFQKSLYRVAAQALYGVDNATRLTQKDKEFLALNFSVDDGCTELLATLSNFFEKLGENMDSKHKMVVMCVIAALITGGVVYKIYSDNGVAQSQEETKIKLEQERTKQIEILLKKNADLGRIQSHIENGVKSIVQSAAGADEITYFGYEFNSSVISAITERAKRTPTTAEIINSTFKVTQINTAESALFKFLLKNTLDEKEFTATLESSEFDAEKKLALCSAAVSNNSINLTVSITRANENIRAARIEAVGEVDSANV